MSSSLPIVRKWRWYDQVHALNAVLEKEKNFFLEIEDYYEQKCEPKLTSDRS